MSDDLPFVHTPDDPSDERTARARARVGRAMSRRRARNRALLAAPVVAVLATVAVGLATTGDDESGREVRATTPEPTTAPSLDVDPDTTWDGAILSTDGRTLEISVGSSPDGEGPCEQAFDHDVVETDEGVTVGFDERERPPSTEREGCTLLLQPQVIDVELAEPLGDRPVFDGVQPGPRTVFRKAELAEVTWLPPGEWVGDASPREDDGGWQQTFTGPGADWYFAVIQEPTASAEPLAGPSEPVAIGGVEGRRYPGQMNGTLEYLQWEVGETTIRIFGEMQGPPTFTHSDELLRIAEGIRLPQG